LLPRNRIALTLKLTIIEMNIRVKDRSGTEWKMCEMCRSFYDGSHSTMMHDQDKVCFDNNIVKLERSKYVADNLCDGMYHRHCQAPERRANGSHGCSQNYCCGFFCKNNAKHRHLNHRDKSGASKTPVSHHSDRKNHMLIMSRM
jgi:hypothetical protein